MTSREKAQARDLIRAVRAELGRDPRAEAELSACERRLDEPLRVALAGTLKAGKSTLLNALVGDEIAPTDATECTRVVTWFRQSDTPRVDLTHDGGHVRPLPVLRHNGQLALELGAVTADRVDKLEVHWPSSLLDEYTLIDTPGTSSNSRDVSERTLRLLTPEDGACEADAVVYLMRNLHGSDVRLLEQVQTYMSAGAGPLGIIGVLSRADEVDGGKGETLDAAKKVSESLTTASELRGLHRNFVPVSGLLALRGQTLRQSEFDALTRLASAPAEDFRAAMLSVARFTSPDSRLPASHDERVHLAEAFGMFGVKMAVAMIRSGIGDAPALAAELLRHSGLDELRRTLKVQFGQRNEQLKAHSALQTLKRILAGHRSAQTAELSRQIDGILADTHAFAELRFLSNLHTVQLDSQRLDLLDRVLGGKGMAPHQRLGLPADAGRSDIIDTAMRAIRYWRAQLDNPMIDRNTAQTCRAAVRSCEAILAAGTPRDPAARSMRPPNRRILPPAPTSAGGQR